MVEVYVVSAFSKENQGGNKAGIVLDSHNLTPVDMAVIAKDLGYSETAFLMESNIADFKIRYFTPTEEVPLCGHATIATFSLLNSLSKLSKGTYILETKAGNLNIRIEKDGMIFMEQNCPIYFETLAPNIFAGCLENRFIDTSLPIQIVSTGLKDIILPVDSKDHLNKLNPNFKNIASLCQDLNVVGIHAFTLTKGSKATAICRNFAPRYGIDEESATGTSNCALACYLFKHYDQQSQYIFEQGSNLGSASQLIVNITHYNSTINMVYVGGQGHFVCKKIIEASRS
ncbi:MAG: PhzF family phenazine biosynthesis protein [Ruminococcus sp.]|nr:PhzF family phenazine biosynthesis protein [Ruminococcus sp.]